MSRNITVITGSRADYGLLYWLLKAIQEEESLELSIVATGMHLSKTFGMTVKQILNDGFEVKARVDMHISGDTPVEVTKSLASGIAGFADVFSTLNTDLLVVLGDRVEILAAASAAMIARVPIAHLHGGELSEGAIDDSIRHAVTKMSHIHFVSAEEHRQRVLQLGESADHVFNVGAMGIDNIRKLSLLGKELLEEKLGIKFAQQNLLITFHPVTRENSTAGGQFAELLAALDNFPDVFCIFTMPNSDTDGRIIMELIEDYIGKNASRSAAFTALGSLNYLSIMNLVDGVVGNSSSGLIEAPSFKLGTVNIGDRQRGRICAASVINCAPECEQITAAIKLIMNDDFRQGLKHLSNPYGNGGAAARVVDVLKNIPLSNILKKQFIDMIVENPAATT